MAVQGNKKFSITPNRKAVIVQMLQKQHTINTLALAFGITRKTMSKALKRAKIDADTYRVNGMANVRSRMFERLEDVDKDDKYVELSLKVLDKYGSILEDADTDTDGSTAKIKNIAKEIMNELNE